MFYVRQSDDERVYISYVYTHIYRYVHQAIQLHCVLEDVFSGEPDQSCSSVPWNHHQAAANKYCLVLLPAFHITAAYSHTYPFFIVLCSWFSIKRPKISARRYRYFVRRNAIACQIYNRSGSFASCHQCLRYCHKDATIVVSGPHTII